MTAFADTDVQVDGRTLSRSAWLEEIEAVLRGDVQVTLVFQPIVDLQRLTAAGYETLARFPRVRNVGPDAWFHHAHALGVGAELETHIVRQALKEAAGRPAGTFLTINADPRTLCSRVFEQAVADRFLGGIVFELTEHAELCADGLDLALAGLRQAGALIALDDAGSGYSGLQAMLDIRPELIKLDRSLVRDVHLDPAKQLLAKMLGDFAGRIDAWVLAEGVETYDEARAFADIGVPLAQGWFFARPAPSWAPLDAGVGELRTVADSQTKTMAHLVQPALWAFPGDETVPALRQAPNVVTVDTDMRPIQVQRCGQRRTGPALTMSPETPPVEALHRAMTRPVEARYDPVLVTDATGRLLGWVPVDVLIRDALTALENAR